MLQPELGRHFSHDLVNKDCLTGNTQEPKQRDAVEGNPFSFTPQLIHLHKDHELFEDGDIHRHMYLQDVYISEAEDRTALGVSEFACHISGCNSLFSTLEEYEHHYNSLHRHECCSCNRSLPSARLLDIHIQEWHDSLFTVLAQRKDMYQCLVEGCVQKFRTSKNRKDHLIRIHKYPPDFRFDKTKKDRGTQETKRQQQKDIAMEVVHDARESQGVCEVPSDQSERGESMEMHVADGEAVFTEEHTDTPAVAHGSGNTSTEPPKPRYSYRVPANVCFGHGSVRGFRGWRGKRK